MTDPYPADQMADEGFDPDQLIGPDDVLMEPFMPGGLIGVDDRGDLVPKDNAPDDTSDGFHTFAELYEHRRALTTVLATIAAINGDSWRSKAHHPDDSTIFDGYFIVGIELPDGTVTYHYPLSDWDKFDVVQELEHAPKWDGATAPETPVRLDLFADHLRAAIREGREVQEKARAAAEAVAEGSYDADGMTDGSRAGSPHESNEEGKDA